MIIDAEKQNILANRGFEPEQVKQIEDASALIPDRATQRLIANPFLEPDEMQKLIVIACSHPGAAIDFYELTVKENNEIRAEIFALVQARAKAFLKPRFELATGGVSYKTFKDMERNMVLGRVKMERANGYCYGQLDQIWKGIESGVDVFCYAKPGFDYMQMCQIRMGLMAGIDVKEYADPSIEWQKMEARRKELEPARKDLANSVFLRLEGYETVRQSLQTKTSSPVQEMEDVMR